MESSDGGRGRGGPPKKSNHDGNNKSGKKQPGRGGRGGRGRGRPKNTTTNTTTTKISMNGGLGLTATNTNVHKTDELVRQHHRNNNNNNNNNNHNNNKNQQNVLCPPYLKLEDCMKRYNTKDPNMIRGVIRFLPVKDGMAFLSCDRGSQKRDVIVETRLEQNRALDGDTVFVELLPEEDEEKQHQQQQETMLPPKEEADSEAGDQVVMEETWWQDDPVQMSLWAPVVPIQVKANMTDKTPTHAANAIAARDAENVEYPQRKGKVVCVVPPKALTSEIKTTKNGEKQQQAQPFRKIVGTLKRLQSGTTLLTCANKSLPQFRLSKANADMFANAPPDAFFKAKYHYGSWPRDGKWPPCSDVERFGSSCNVEDETQVLLMEHGVDHGDHSAEVLEECQQVVSSGEYTSDDGQESGWKPTQDMYKGRRDYRKERIFTIDPTTAKDLDDALHIKELPKGEIEIGVHIADVSYFVEDNSRLDEEAQRRCTTVYLVDRTIPMLPRPLCEIACSLNENVERLAFSCVWKMNRDGSLVAGQQVWYGRTVIKSCARLDYSTAQNIIENKVGIGEEEPDEDLWPKSRRPTGGHTIAQVAADVRLMNVVAKARRAMRFENGAIALNAVKLTFQLDGDGETPLLCKPYAIRDSNRLVEEYMLLANFLVAQRLITHAKGLALLRNHERPLPEGLKKVAEFTKEILDFKIDIESSKALQRSLNRLGREFVDDPLVLTLVTELFKMPMKAATYIAAGEVDRQEWSHFALNIPYYTHFTSPIRRYADVIVHRLLQATLDGPQAIHDFPINQNEVMKISERCNDKKEASRKAQERSDVVFLALYLKKYPMSSQMGVVMSVGKKTFTVFIPALGISPLVFLDEHKSWIQFTAVDHENDMYRKIELERRKKHNDETWKKLTIKNYAKVRVSCHCKEVPPIDVKLELEGPWVTDGTTDN